MSLSLRTSAARIVDELDDEQLRRHAAGIGRADRAAAAWSKPEPLGPPRFTIPPRVAIAIGWPLCSSCSRPIVPWGVIRWRDGDWHAGCISVELARQS